MSNKFVTLQEYAQHFGLIVLSGYQSLKTRKIRFMQINRPGFELTGFFDATNKNYIVVLGHREIIYINQAKKEDLIKAYDFLTNDECPAIILTWNQECPSDLLNIAKKKNFPILSTGMSSSNLTNATFSYLQEKLAPTTSIHASLVEIYSMGVIIMGQSGIGKSETTLELVKKGHKLVADDRIDISYIRNELIGEAPELLVGEMEVRGIGIIDIKRLFGINSLVRRKKISYVINLVPFEQDKPFDRLGNNVQYYQILGVNIPLLNLPVSGARSMAEIIEVAVTNLKLKDDGFDSSFEFENRMNELLRKKKEI